SRSLQDFQTKNELIHVQSLKRDFDLQQSMLDLQMSNAGFPFHQKGMNMEVLSHRIDPIDIYHKFFQLLQSFSEDLRTHKHRHQSILVRSKPHNFSPMIYMKYLQPQ